MDAWKFILYYAFYIMIWIGMWTIGFGDWYTDVYYNKATISFDRTAYSIVGNYTTNEWIEASELNSTILQNLDMGTQVALCVDCTHSTIATLQQSYYLEIYGKYSISTIFYTDYYYNVSSVHPYYGTPINSTINMNEITWVNYGSSEILSAYIIESNTTTGQTVITEATMTPTGLWNQIVLMFGFITGLQNFSNDIWFLSLLNAVLFITFMYCIIGEILIPFGIKIPFV